jgi:peptide/nickel transport system permease protein
MSFLGIGVRPPTPSLGSLISDGIQYADSNLGFVLGPLLVVVTIVLALQLLARALGAARRVTR